MKIEIEIFSPKQKLPEENGYVNFIVKGTRSCKKYQQEGYFVTLNDTPYFRGYREYFEVIKVSCWWYSNLLKIIESKNKEQK